MKRSISFKIIGTCLFISLLFFVPMASVNVEKAREILEASHLEKAKTIARMLDANVRSGAALRDKDRLYTYIQKNIWLDPDIINIDIYLPQQDTLVAYVSNENTRSGRFADKLNLDSYKNDILISRIYKQDNQRYLRVAAPIHIAKQQAGTFQIELTLENVDTQIMTAIKLSVFSYLVATLLFALLFFWFLRLIIIKPVKEMNKGVKNLAKGDLEWRVMIKSHDEIGDLAAAFNQMTHDLKGYSRTLEERGITLQEEVDERKAVEKALQKAHENMERQVEGRTAELLKANVKLQQEIDERKQAEKEKTELEEKLVRSQKMEALGLLAGGVAHDLNNVLSGIVSYPDLILFDLPEDSPLKKPMLTIQDSGKKAAAIVRDLLTLARRGVTQTVVLNLNDIISDYLKSPEYEKLKISHPNVHTNSTLATDLLNIAGSPIHLRKALMNLVINAAEAQPTGGKISISTENQYIDRPKKGYENVKQGDFTVLKIEDNGHGIAPDDLNRIFEPFYTKKVMGRSGTGLGMAVVWGTVQDHSGYINISSTEKKGTTIELYFPVTREKLPAQKHLMPVETYKGNNESVLVIDDIKEQREIASTILKKLNYSVKTVPSGEEAVKYLQDNNADLLVLDMIMDPGMDGLDTYKKIIKLHSGQRAIIASGFSETERVREAQKLGAGQYVKKPYTLEKIGVAVRNELDKKKPELSGIF